jgi:phosphodiesterase/alkaline phosphatase D-like protein
MLALALLAPGAQAVLYQPASAIVPKGDPVFPSAMAIDGASGDMYVGANFLFGELAVHRFDSNRAESTFGKDLFASVGVDPTNHNVLTLSTAGNLITFNHDGSKKLGSVPLGENSGQMAVGAAGNFFINSPEGVHEYSSAGVLKQTIDCSACPDPASFGAAKAIALDANAQHLYVADTGNNRVLKFTSSGGDPADFTSVAPTVFATGAAVSVAVDPNTGNVFVGGDDGAGYHVKGYDSSGTQFTDFGLGTFANSFAGLFAGWNGDQVAVDPADGHVYVADIDFSVPRTRIWEYAPVIAPSAASALATAIGQASAQLNAQVDPNGDTVTDCHFEYGLTESYGQLAPCGEDPGFGEDPVAVSAGVSDLAANTTYHYLVVATNAAGTVKSTDEEFTTLIEKAAVSTGGSSGVSSAQATISGSVDPKGNPVSACRFEYGSTLSYGTQVPCPTDPGSGSGAVSESIALSGLAPNTTYHYRLVAENGGGLTEGADASFATLPEAPLAQTGDASGIDPVSAKIAGRIDPRGAAASYRFEYGTSAAYGQSSPAGTASGRGESAPSTTLTALKPSTIYHYRLVASSAGGSAQGQDRTFTTADRPKGRLALPATASLKAGKASVLLECKGPAISHCESTLVLRARVKQGIRLILVAIGSADFDIAGDKTAPVSVSLNANGKKALAGAAGKPLHAVASADGHNRELLIASSGARKHNKHAKRR